jgi:hypothetical protein
MEIELNPDLTPAELEARAQYERAMSLAATAKDNAREAVLALADCGTMLMVAKDNQRGSKADWLARIGIPAGDAEKAVHLARNREQLMLDLWPSDVAKVGTQWLGLLPPPSSAAGEPVAKGASVALGWFSFAGKLTKSLDAMVESRPIEKWEEHERQNVALVLKPILEFAKKLDNF